MKVKKIPTQFFLQNIFVLDPHIRVALLYKKTSKKFFFYLTYGNYLESVANVYERRDNKQRPLAFKMPISRLK